MTSCLNNVVALDFAHAAASTAYLEVPNAGGIIINSTTGFNGRLEPL